MKYGDNITTTPTAVSIQLRFETPKTSINNYGVIVDSPVITSIVFGLQQVEQYVISFRNRSYYTRLHVHTFRIFIIFISRKPVEFDVIELFISSTNSSQKVRGIDELRFCLYKI